MSDISKFVQENKGVIFRFLEYRRVGDWTPYEQEAKFTDESQFVDTRYQFAYIEQAYELPNQDVMFKFSILDPDTKEEYGIYEYAKFNEIKLSMFDCDQDSTEDM